MSKDIIVSSMDVNEEYSVIGPIICQYCNEEHDGARNIHEYGKKYYSQKIENEYYNAIQELKKRAKKIGADAIIGMRLNSTIDSNYPFNFNFQVYGTAVRFFSHTDNEEEKIIDANKEICIYCKRESDIKYNICEFCGKYKH